MTGDVAGSTAIAAYLRRHGFCFNGSATTEVYTTGTSGLHRGFGHYADYGLDVRSILGAEWYGARLLEQLDRPRVELLARRHLQVGVVPPQRPNQPPGGGGGPARRRVELPDPPVHLRQRLGDHRADGPQRMLRRNPRFRGDVAEHRFLLRIRSTHRRTSILRQITANLPESSGFSCPCGIVSVRLIYICEAFCPRHVASHQTRC